MSLNSVKQLKQSVIQLPKNFWKQSLTSL